MRLCDAVRQSRRQKGLSQSELAGKVGISQRSLSLIETGKCNPTWDTVAALGRELGVPIADVLDKLVQSQAKGRAADPRKAGRLNLDLDMRVSAAVISAKHDAHGKSNGRQCRYCGHLVRSGPLRTPVLTRHFPRPGGQSNGPASPAKPNGGSS